MRREGGGERERVGAGGSERELAASSDDAADAICQKISTSSTLTQEAKFRLPQPINASHRRSPPPPSPPSHSLSLPPCLHNATLAEDGREGGPRRIQNPSRPHRRQLLAGLFFFVFFLTTANKEERVGERERDKERGRERATLSCTRTPMGCLHAAPGIDFVGGRGWWGG